MVIYSWSVGASCVVFVTYCLAYVVYAFIENLPWESCKDSWQHNCYTAGEESMLCKSVNKTIYEMYSNISLISTNENMSWISVAHKNMIARVPVYIYMNYTKSCLNATRSAAEAYLIDKLWKMSSGIDDTGVPKLDLSMGIFIVWGLIYLCNWSAAALKRYTATMLCVMILMMGTTIVRVSFLPGALAGILSIAKVDIDQLLNFRVWRDAVHQVVSSMASCRGLTFFLGSQSEYGEHISMACVKLCVVHVLLGLISTLIVYGMVGTLSVRRGTSIDDFETSVNEVNLATPTEVSQEGALPHILVTVYFLMLVTAGLSTEVQFIRASTNDVMGQAHECYDDQEHSAAGILCILGFVLGIPLVFNAGPHLFFLVVRVMNEFVLSVVCTTEVIAFTLVYGVDRISRDLDFMLDRRPNAYWRYTWILSLPLLTMFLLLSRLSGIAVTDLVGLEGYVYPSWCGVSSLVVIVAVLSPIPYFAVRHLVKN
ncbi:unnamed protein product, partial [Ixodes hexagonus]